MFFVEQKQLISAVSQTLLNVFQFFFLSFQTWDPWNVPLALSCAVRVFRLLSQVTLLRFGCIEWIIVLTHTYIHVSVSLYLS